MSEPIDLTDPMPDADFLEHGEDLPTADIAAREPAAEIDGLRAARTALADPATWAEAPPDGQRQLMAAIAEASERSAAVHTTLAPPQRRWQLGVAAAAAAVMLLVGSFAAGRDLASRDRTPVDQTVTMAPTDYATDASATATLTDTPSGIEIVLTIEGLPPAGPDEYYQGWLKTNDDVGVTIGTFHLRGDEEPVVLWSGLDLDDVALVTVTIQSIDGGPASSGIVVLKAAVE